MDRGEFLKILGVTAASTLLSGLPAKSETKDKVKQQSKSHSQEAVVNKPVTALVIVRDRVEERMPDMPADILKH